MNKTSLLIAILCSVCVSQVAYANHHLEGQSMEKGKCEGMSQGSFSISALDANKDGNITKTEYLDGDKSNSEKVFNHMDANRDGKLDQSEQAEIEAVYKAIHNEYKSKNTSI